MARRNSRPRIAAGIALAAACGLLQAASLAAQSTSGDDVQAVVARYTEAIGGLERLRAIQTLRKTGTYVYNGLEHPIVAVQKRGGRYREEIEGLTTWGTTNESDTVVVRAFDGERAWVGRQGESLETEEMPEAEAAGFVIDAELEGPLVDYAAKGHRVELLGATEIEGIPAIQLAVTRADGGVEQWYLDSESYLPAMKSIESVDGGPKAAQTWYFDDYRDVAGVLIPHYVQIEEMLFAREYLFDSIEANPAVDDDIFVRPAGTQTPR